ncbi:Sulfate permease-like protein 1 [Elsinoe fawcettii]|nr:Sulfate permease-like protein 1 [Elsinoe fawcettii]
MAQPSPNSSGPSGGGSPGHSRSSSTTPTWSQHVPANPSGLRNSRVVSNSSDNLGALSTSPERMDSGSSSLPHQNEDGNRSPNMDLATPYSDEEDTHVGRDASYSRDNADVRTRLLDQRHSGQSYGTNERANGTYSPRPQTHRTVSSIDSITFGFASRFLPESLTRRETSTDDPLMQQEMDMTKLLAQRHGITDRRKMYIFYYFPFLNWIRQYRWIYVRGDLISAFTMASFYLPMSLSYAANLGHLPPINGLYSFAFNPFIYALLGTCPQMVVGPEAAGSLLTGQVVRENIANGKHRDDDFTKSTQIAGMVTGLSGAVILVAGLCRLGFLDSVLSRPFLRGFICAIGIVIFVDQLIPEMGLDKIAHGAVHGSSLDKIMFLLNNYDYAHGLTCAVSFGAFAIVMVCREVKKQLQPRMEWVAYIPDRFIVVVLSAVFAWRFDWQAKGLDILGDIRAEGRPFKAHFPFEPTMLEHATDAFSTSILVALLGFFESSVAAKSLGAAPKRKQQKKVNSEGEEEPDGIEGVIVSPNRELVALGVANIIGGLFMALPAFGGYGRSKVNASTGGKTPMSSIFLSIITVICILFLLPYFYYIPKGVLSAMISVVAYSLIEEAPHDISFFWRIAGYSELLLMLLIFLTTFLWNLRIGIFAGIALSLLRLLRHSTRPRIQILGRVPGSKTFENAELHALRADVDGELEFVENVLIIKIPEPLTFANTGSLKDRLRRIEEHGTGAAHPALPRVRRSDMDKVLVIDCHGVTSMDPAAAQVLLEIVEGYRDRGVRIYFARVMGRRSEVWRLMKVSGIVELVGGEGKFVGSVTEALELVERDRGVEQGLERAVRGAEEDVGGAA